MAKVSGCDENDVSLKSFFLGPQAENAELLKSLFDQVFEQWIDWRCSLYPNDGRAISLADQSSSAYLAQQEKFTCHLKELVRRFEDEVPKFSPRYIGHMFSETSLPALMGHILTLLHNPNNISSEASRVGVALEREAVADLALMLGFAADATHGHFTSCGTIANIEALYRARNRLEAWLTVGSLANHLGLTSLSCFEAGHMGWERFEQLRGELARMGRNIDNLKKLMSNPMKRLRFIDAAFDIAFEGPILLVPRHAHYSWPKGARLLGIGEEAIVPVDLDSKGRMNPRDLNVKIRQARTNHRPVIAVVSVAGTTELGVIDPISDVTEILEELSSANDGGCEVWHHVDAAYGGFFACLDSSKSSFAPNERSQHDLRAIRQASSVTIDPHKLGYVPYASGALVVSSYKDYVTENQKAPYIDFDYKHDPGLQTIEGSRSAAGAVATWLTSRCIGFDEAGYGRILSRTLSAKAKLALALKKVDDSIRMLDVGDLNIIGFCVGRPGEPLSKVNARTMDVFNAFSHAKNGSFMVSKTMLDWQNYGEVLNHLTASWLGGRDQASLVVIRICLLNPFFDSIEPNVSYHEEFARELRRTLENA